MVAVWFVGRCHDFDCVLCLAVCALGAGAGGLLLGFVAAFRFLDLPLMVVFWMFVLLYCCEVCLLSFLVGACGCCGLCSNLVRSSGVSSGFLVFYVVVLVVLDLWIFLVWWSWFCGLCCLVCLVRYLVSYLVCLCGVV